MNLDGNPLDEQADAAQRVARADRPEQAAPHPPAFRGDEFVELLRQLDPDPDQANHKYIRLRNRLAAYSDWKGLAADELFDSVMKVLREKLSHGVPIKDVERFAAGVARNQARAHHTHLPLREEIVGQVPCEPSGDGEAVVQCLKRCLDVLPKSRRRVLLAYVGGHRTRRTRKRRALAEDLGVSNQAVRLRIHRIRGELEQCVESCLGKGVRSWRARRKPDRRRRRKTHEA